MIPKKLTQFVASAVETTVYVVPADTYTLLKEILVANTSSSTQTIAISLVPAGNIASYANRILPTVSLAPNQMATFNMSTVMATGDFLSAQASASSAVAVTISGLEDPGTGTSSGTSNFASTGMVVTSGTRPASPYEGQVIYETDTNRLATYDGASWRAGQIVTVATSTTRPSSPFEGQIIYETDTDHIYTWDGAVWTLPRNVAGGYLAAVGNPNGSYAKALSKGTAEQVMASTPAIATLANRRYRIEALMTLTNGGSWNGATLRIRRGTTTGGTQLCWHYVPRITTAAWHTVRFFAFDVPGAQASQQWSMTHTIDTSVCDIYAPEWMSVEDVGAV